ncbi:MAG: 5'/3'-nucleotidase SurE [Rhizobiales bacterium]|nr:5'/3'-nucleotidase SurE [Hyphomicrobiales bacterium]
MRILLTNDDGIEAPGLDVLQQIASELSSDVWVVAPETDQSGAGHSLTLREPLRCRNVGERIYAVRGTPTDCVIMAVRHLMGGEKPDLLLSGVNRGQNMADDVTYSGTIAGAMEGVLLGIPSIAMSLCIRFQSPDSIHWETPMAHGSGLVRRLLGAGWPSDVLVNVNFPDRPPAEVEGIAITRQGRRDQGLLNIVDRMDTRGHPYYWFGFERSKSPPESGTDLWATQEGMISVTPLHLDLTHEVTRRALAGIAGPII